PQGVPESARVGVAEAAQREPLTRGDELAENWRLIHTAAKRRDEEPGRPLPREQEPLQELKAVSVRPLEVIEEHDERHAARERINEALELPKGELAQAGFIVDAAPVRERPACIGCAATFSFRVDRCFYLGDASEHGEKRGEVPHAAFEEQSDVI